MQKQLQVESMQIVCNKLILLMFKKDTQQNIMNIFFSISILFIATSQKMFLQKLYLNFYKWNLFYIFN